MGNEYKKTEVIGLIPAPIILKNNQEVCPYCRSSVKDTDTICKNCGKQIYSPD